MTHTRYSQDAAYELAGLEARIASNRKSARNSVNPKSAGIADAVLSSLERKAAALRDEVATLPERPDRRFGCAEPEAFANAPILTLTEAQVAALENEPIPEFLRRR
jgi:hypothetical protein